MRRRLGRVDGRKGEEVRKDFGALECVFIALIVFALMYLSFSVGRWVC